MSDDDESEITNKRRKAAKAADELRDNMMEILATPISENNAGDIDAKRHAAAALDGIEEAEDALRAWRAPREEAIERLGEEPLDADDGESGRCGMNE